MPAVTTPTARTRRGLWRRTEAPRTAPLSEARALVSGFPKVDTHSPFPGQELGTPTCVYLARRRRLADREEIHNGPGRLVRAWSGRARRLGARVDASLVPGRRTGRAVGRGVGGACVAGCP